MSPKSACKVHDVVCMSVMFGCLVSRSTEDKNDDSMVEMQSSAPQVKTSDAKRGVSSVCNSAFISRFVGV